VIVILTAPASLAGDAVVGGADPLSPVLPGMG
jgi:hypothetical protein